MFTVGILLNTPLTEEYKKQILHFLSGKKKEEVRIWGTYAEMCFLKEQNYIQDSNTMFIDCEAFIFEEHAKNKNNFWNDEYEKTKHLPKRLLKNV